ncbi:MFS transporter [Chrysiogenes arsenatis]|uniref:MFS transporter n=1 Tax=Chrysiogenes arsenatis TaxID=309797 RepID=UPI0003F6F94A|nr:MFS transporter [Chrysiogenes arsenatis]
MNYFSCIRLSPRLLLFGFLGTFFSAFGQTYFLALFNADVQQALQLTHGTYGLLYSAATLGSGITLIWLGRLVDRFDVRYFALAVCVGLALACLLFAGVAGWASLLLAFFALRLCGQGLMSHTAVTTLARCFTTNRGKALSITVMGFAAAEAVFPATAVALNALVSWRTVWIVFAIGILVVVAPLWYWLAKSAVESRVVTEAANAETVADVAAERHWRASEVLRDRAFQLILPAATATPAVITGLFFHQLSFATDKGWPPSLLAASFSAFALAHVTALVIMGGVIDRWGARRVLPFILIPMLLGVAVFTFLHTPLVAFLYMALMGMTIGVTNTTINALWAEIYGTKFLGGIRSMTQGVMVISTAVAPFLVGFALDTGFGVYEIGSVAILYIAFCVALCTLGTRRLERRIAHLTEK